MGSSNRIEELRSRRAALEMSEEEFRAVGHELVDRIAGFLGSVRGRAVTPSESVDQVRAALDSSRGLPESGADAEGLMRGVAELMFEHSLLNGHPRFFGYVTSSAAPVGMLAELLAAAVNANVGAWKLAPIASEIEGQTIRWLAEFLGFPVECGGLLLSGGNMANLTCFWAARVAKADWDIRKGGVAGGPKLVAYASKETHTWIQKAADLSGLGTDAIRWIGVDSRQRIDVLELEAQYRRDVDAGYKPFLVTGSAGTVSTGAVDPLPELAAFAKEHGLWFHVDGAYGAFAAGAAGAPADLAGLSLADSVAVDPHKWLYSPLEAGCALVRDVAALRNAFSYHPPYYNFEGQAMNYFDVGPQNSRGFRALKVWLALQQVGAARYRETIADDIALARYLFELAGGHSQLEAFTNGLSITTLRYVPVELRASVGEVETERYLDRLNQRVLEMLEKGGEAFCSNAVIGGKFALRFCIVNFRTSTEDVEAMPELVARLGEAAHVELSRNRFV